MHAHDQDGGPSLAKRRNGVRRSRRFWLKTVQEWRSSGLTQREFAKSKGVAMSTLSRWARNLLDEFATGLAKPRVAAAPPATFVEVVARVDTSERPRREPSIRLLLGAAVAEFDELPPPEYLAAVGLCAEGARCR